MGDLTKATAVYYELGASLKLSNRIIIIGGELTGVLFLRFEKLNDGVFGRVRCFVHNAVISKFPAIRASVRAVVNRLVLLPTCLTTAAVNFSVRSERLPVSG